MKLKALLHLLFILPVNFVYLLYLLLILISTHHNTFNQAKIFSIFI